MNGRMFFTLFAFVMLTASVLVACVTPVTPTIILPEPSPTPRCINDFWSYTDNVTTRIKITSALKITLEDSWGGMIQNADTGTTSEGDTTDRIIIYGDGRVVFDGETHPRDINKSNHYEKRISADQLRQIIAGFEEANFYAISHGCKGENAYGMVRGAGPISISIETEDKTVTLSDYGDCKTVPKSRFSNFCDLSEKVNAILGP